MLIFYHLIHLHRQSILEITVHINNNIIGYNFILYTVYDSFMTIRTLLCNQKNILFAYISTTLTIA